MCKRLLRTRKKNFLGSSSPYYDIPISFNESFAGSSPDWLIDLLLYMSIYPIPHFTQFVFYEVIRHFGDCPIDGSTKFISANHPFYLCIFNMFSLNLIDFHPLAFLVYPFPSSTVIRFLPSPNECLVWSAESRTRKESSFIDMKTRRWDRGRCPIPPTCSGLTLAIASMSA